MSDREQPRLAFYAFAREVKGFEQTLYRLVASSFLISGVAAVAKAHFSDQELLATITLVGTAAGCSAVLSTYLGSAHRPEEENWQTIHFDPKRAATVVRFYFGLRLISLVFYTTVPAELILLSLFLVAVAVYCFFRALVAGAVAARRLESQQNFWNELGAEGREKWRLARLEEIERQQQLEKFFQESRESREETDREKRQIDRTLRRFRRDEIKYKVRKVWRATGGRLYRWSVNIRVRLAGERLLTRGERLERFSTKQTTEKRLEELRAAWARETHEMIFTGKLRPLIDEKSNLSLYKRDSWTYLRMTEKFTKSSAEFVISNLINSESTDNSIVRIGMFLEDGAVLTKQAEEMLKEHGIRYYYPADWEEQRGEPLN